MQAAPVAAPDDLAFLFALEKAAGKQLKDADPLAPGIYPVDTTVSIHLKGMIEQCPNQHYNASPATPWPAVIALFAYRVKLSRDQVEEILGEVMADVLSQEDVLPKIKAFPDRIRDIDRIIKNAVEAAPKIPKSRAGALKWTGEATIEG